MARSIFVRFPRTGVASQPLPTPITTRHTALLLAVFAAILLVWTTTPADAARYDRQELGETIPYYSEHRMGINASGDVAWTALAGPPRGPKSPQARVTIDGQPPTTLPHGQARSYAEDINDAKHAVGYTSSAANERDAAAAVWVWNGTAYTHINLGVDVQSRLGGPTGPLPETSAAYGISPRLTDFVPPGEARYWVAGYIREKAAGNQATARSIPVLWKIRVNSGSGTVISMVQLNRGSTDPTAYGVAYGVTEKGQVAGGIGFFGSYLTAATWNLPTAIPSRIPGTDASTAGVASSLANRIRTVSLNGVSTSVAVGHAFLGGSLMADTIGFIYTLSGAPTSPNPDDTFGLTGGTKRLLMDVSVGRLPAAIAGQFTEGLHAVGLSNSTVLGVGGVNNPFTDLTTAGAQLVDIGSNAQVCDINDQAPISVNELRFIQAINAAGTVVGWDTGGKAVRLTPAAPTNAALQVFVRDTPSMIGQAPYRHFWGEQPKNGTAGSLLFSNSAGCGSGFDIGCSDGAFDLSDSGAFGADHLYLTFETSNASVQHTNKEVLVASQPLPALAYEWMQATSEGAGICALSPVQRVTHHQTNPDGYDPWGELWCDKTSAVYGSETNIHVSEEHCGLTCNTASGIDDGHTCTDDACNAGVITNALQSDKCLINSGIPNITDCYSDGDPDPYGYRPALQGMPRTASCSAVAVSPPIPNPCATCDTSGVRTTWTGEVQTRCCQAGEPRLDIYDVQGATINNVRGGALNGDGCGVDGNHGRSRMAWWIEPRSLNAGNTDYSNKSSLNQHSRWNTVSGSGIESCNLSADTNEPQVLLKLNGTNDSDLSRARVRRIRAHFTPRIDTDDWYMVNVHKSGADNSTASPRGRVISHDGQELEMCIYAYCTTGVNINISGVVSRNGTTPTAQTPPTNSPATIQPRGLGRCTKTVGGIADLSLLNYSGCKSNDHQNSWFAYHIRPTSMPNDLNDPNNSATCEDYRYTLFYGNDYGINSSGGGVTACDDCCTDSIAQWPTTFD